MLRRTPTAFRFGRRIFRAAALVLLLFGIADLALPQLCAEATGPLPTTAAAPVATALERAAAPDDAQPQPARAGDCFVCCGHVMPAQTFSLATADLPSVLPESSTMQPLPTVTHLIELPPRTA